MAKRGSRPPNWTHILCGCDGEPHRLRLHAKKPLLEAYARMARDGSVGKCPGGRPYLIRMHQWWTNSQRWGDVTVAHVLALDPPEGEEDIRLFFALEERDLPSSGAKPQRRDRRVQFQYWGNDDQGRPKYGEFAKQVTVEQFLRCAEFMKQKNWA